MSEQKEECKNCKFSNQIKFDESITNECRRFPPSILNKNPTNNNCSDFYSYVNDDMWCGEWRSKDNKQDDIVQLIKKMGFTLKENEIYWPTPFGPKKL